MKIGDIVQIVDGSYSAIYAGGILCEEMAIACKPRKYVILLIQDGLPAFHGHGLPDPRHVEYDNDVLIQDLNDPARLVFTRLDFLGSAEYPPGRSNGCDLAKAFEVARTTATELFGTAACYELVMELAMICLQDSGHQRDLDYAKCIIKMHGWSQRGKTNCVTQRPMSSR